MANEAKKHDQYFKWDNCTWGTHRVNCYPGSCPFRVYSQDGKVVREELACTYPEFTDPDFPVPDYNPRGCQKGAQHSKAMYGAERLRRPHKRVGPRGSGQWEPIGWDQAFDEIGQKFAEIIKKYGAQSLIEDHGTNGPGLARGGAEATAPAIAGIMGGTSFDLNHNIGDFNVGQYLTFGQFQHTPGIENWFLADTLIIQCSNPVYANIPDIHYMLEARYRGAKLIGISIDKTPTQMMMDHWIPMEYSADPAMWLGVCKILIDRGWIDMDFMREQTDLPILIRKDDQRFLRESDLKKGGDDQQFYVLDEATKQLVAIPKDTLAMACTYALEGEATVTLADGSKVEVTTVFAKLKERLEEYTPEKVHEMSGVHPDTLEMLAESVRPPKKVFVFINWNSGKLYHGDLIERGFCYMLALTGNVGKAGTGTRGWSAGAEFLATMPVLSGLPEHVVKAPNPILAALGFMMQSMQDYRQKVKMDPTMPPVEASFGIIREMMKNILAPPIFHWSRHCGYREVWDKYLDDPYTKKKISEYMDEAVANGWWEGFDNPPADIPPRALFVSGSNLLRRNRGGIKQMLQTLWKKLELIVVADTRWSSTVLNADYALPAASYYEYADTKYTTPQSRFIILTDKAVPYLDESLSDRSIMVGLIKSIQKHLQAMGVEEYKVGDREFKVSEFGWRADQNGTYPATDEGEEKLVDETYKVMSMLGWAKGLNGEQEVGLENLRENGMAWLTGRPAWHAVTVQNSEMIPGDIHVCFTDQVIMKVPYHTTTRRMQFYIDHPWFIEADEHLVRFKRPPNIGGAQPRRLTSGHLRWSIHANWVVAEEMLKLHRGEPFAFINREVAQEKGIGDNDYIRVYNDYGSFKTRAKLSPNVRPDQLVIYHAWEPYQYPEGMPYDGLLPGPPKGLHLAGGYRHFEYTLWNWGPTQSDRQTNVEFEKA
jgi:DMSO reductase family type II enzyme molybdopterin subunit